MCAPMAFAIVGMAMSAASAVMSGIAKAQAASAGAANAEYQAKIADLNAFLAGQDANEVMQDLDTDVQNATIQKEEIIGQQVAEFSGANILIDGSGSASKALVDTALLSSIDTNTLIDNARRKAYGLRVEQSEYKREALTHLLEKRQFKKERGFAIAGAALQVGVETGLGASSIYGGGSGNFKSRRVNRTEAKMTNGALEPLNLGLGS